MKKIYLEYSDDEKVQRSVAQLPWRHNISNPIGVSSYEIKDYISRNILDKFPTEDDINMHINIDEKKN